jgi:hypothetical protein
VQSLADRAVDELGERHLEWADAARQDAIESVRRMSRWHLVRRGCRVPVHDLYFVSMRRAAELLARRFIDQAAPPTAAYLGLQDAELVLAGKGCIEALDPPNSQTDLTVSQGLWEPRLDFVVRFEVELNAHLEHLYQDRVRPHLAATIERISGTWAARAQG